MHSNLLQLLGKKFDDLIEGLTLLELENTKHKLLDNLR